jgi:hypothetical protein
MQNCFPLSEHGRLSPERAAGALTDAQEACLYGTLELGRGPSVSVSCGYDDARPPKNGSLSVERMTDRSYQYPAKRRHVRRCLAWIGQRSQGAPMEDSHLKLNQPRRGGRVMSFNDRKPALWKSK